MCTKACIRCAQLGMFLSMYTNVLCSTKTVCNRHKQCKWRSTSLNGFCLPFSPTPIYQPLVSHFAYCNGLFIVLHYLCKKKVGNQCKSDYHNLLMSIIVSVKNLIMWFTLFIFHKGTLKHWIYEHWIMYHSIQYVGMSSLWDFLSHIHAVQCLDGHY